MSKKQNEKMSEKISNNTKTEELPKEKTEQTEQAETEEEKAVKRRKQNIQFVMFAGILIIIFLAIVFVPKYLQQKSLNYYKYNNFDFAKTEDGHWYTVVEKQGQPFQISFYYHPSELEDIPVEANLRDKFFDIRDNNGTIYITLDPESSNNTIIVAGVEIAKITGTGYGLLNVPTHSAFIKEPTNSATDTATPVVTCSNANAKTMVIWLTLSDKNIVYSYGNCVILEAKSYADMIRVADRLMYHLLGIMTN